MMYLTRARPNGAVMRPFDNGIDRLFDELTRGFVAPAEPVAADFEFAPTLDVAETEKEWTVRVELPGVAPEDVAVSVTANILTIRGEKKTEAKIEGENRRRVERTYGRFARTLEFPGDVDAAKIAATAKNGVLTVTLPKAEESRPKTIDVKVV